jgi:hypothetical protein
MTGQHLMGIARVERTAVDEAGIQRVQLVIQPSGDQQLVQPDRQVGHSGNLEAQREERISPDVGRVSVLSDSAQDCLRRNLVVLEQCAATEALREVEDKVALEATAEAEHEAVPGIYVYALPHYLRFPYDEESNRTLLKVGRSDRSVIRRFREQVPTTALPEDPTLLRIYLTSGEDSIHRERQFHELLEAADHARSRARTGGTEWFLTSLRFLDAVAETIGMEARQVYDPDGPD